MSEFYNLGNVKTWVSTAADEIGQRFSVRTVYGWAYRTYTSDHPLGLALDFMTYADLAKGDQISSYAIANAHRLSIKYVIWKQRIWTVTKPYWVLMDDRGSTTANHYDHVHISFLAVPNATNSAPITGAVEVSNVSDTTANPVTLTNLLPPQLQLLIKAIDWIAKPENQIRLAAIVFGTILILIALFSWGTVKSAGLLTIGKVIKK